MTTLYMITCTEPVLGSDEGEHIVFASTDYDAVFERRARITEIDMCHEAHPIRSRTITLDLSRKPSSHSAETLGLRPVTD